MDIFSTTSGPSELIFYKRNDPNDIRLGEVVKREIEDYENSDYVILGVPQDEGVKRNKGRAGASEAPDLIKQQLYKLTANDKIMQKKLFDIGSVTIEGSLEEIHNRLEQTVTQILNDKKILIILGGGNDISYPDCRGLYNFNKDILAFNIDSHLDVRFDKPRNSGTPYNMLLNESVLNFADFFEIGIKDFASASSHKKFLEEKGGNIFYLNEVRSKGLDNILTNILREKNNEVIFWGFDMDVVRASDAPGASAPYPTGITADDAIILSEIAGLEKRTKIFEISEVNPHFDIDSRTSKLAAIMIWSFLNT